MLYLIIQADPGFVRTIITPDFGIRQNKNQPQRRPTETTFATLKKNPENEKASLRQRISAPL
jgi:hypothetical protein